MQKADSLLHNLNLVNTGAGCSILPGYIAPLSMDNTVIRALDVELPGLELYVSYHKNSSSAAVQKLLQLLTRMFGLTTLQTP